MPRTFVRALLLGVLCGAVALAMSACGSGDDERDSAGGRLTVLTSEDVSSLDPGVTYYALDLSILAATQRTLYSYAPDDPTNIVPNLAVGDPQISNDGKTLTVKIRDGVRFSPPVRREVTSRDVKYAIERGFNPNVGSPYAGSYYGDVVGAPEATGGPIEGIETPDDHTIVFRLTRPTASLLAQATILPLSAPVPKEYARAFDAKSPSTYAQHLVSTGPYRFAADARGKVLGEGYRPGKSIRLVRNPSWDPETDDRPANLDAIEYKIGGEATVIARQVLQGRGMELGGAPPASIVKLASERYEDQLFLSPGAGNRYVALNTQIPPFDDANLRKAVAAALDRDRMRAVRGGEILGDVANHFLYPGVIGFEEAGGLEGTGVDFLEAPKGDMELAKDYLRKAGYPDGRYTGKETIQVVGLAGDPDDKDAQIVEQALRDLGFETNLRVFNAAVMYGRFCALPKAKVHVCPNVGWARDFADPQTVLNVPFNGKTILPENNPNWPQLDVPEINAAMDRAETVVGTEARAEAWGEIDRMVTATAGAIPWLWDKQPVITSKDVDCVHQLWNQGHCDLAYSSLE